MAFVKVTGGNTIDIKKKEGDAVVGIFTGSKEITTKIGKQVIWQFVDEDEKPFGVYGFTALNFRMEVIKPGSLVRVTYGGKEKKETKFGLRDVHNCTVEVDDAK